MLSNGDVSASSSSSSLGEGRIKTGKDYLTRINTIILCGKETIRPENGIIRCYILYDEGRLDFMSL